MLPVTHVVVCCFLICVISISSVGGSAQECVESISFDPVPLDVVCDVVRIFEHVKELQCMNITIPLEVCMSTVCISMHVHSLFCIHVTCTYT